MLCMTLILSVVEDVPLKSWHMNFLAYQNHDDTVDTWCKISAYKIYLIVFIY